MVNMGKNDVMISVQALCKMLLHVFKYPHQAVNGLLLASKPTSRNTQENDDEKSGSGKLITIVDAVPLFHITLGLTPMIEVALLQIDQYCKSENLIIAGYYQANENYSDNSPDNIAHRICDKLMENFNSSSLVMIDNERLSIDCDDIPFVLYSNDDGKWSPKDSKSVHLDLGSIALDVACNLLHSKLYRDIVDFDNHLDDVTCDWLNPQINTQIKDVVSSFPTAS